MPSATLGFDNTKGANAMIVDNTGTVLVEEVVQEGGVLRAESDEEESEDPTETVRQIQCPKNDVAFHQECQLSVKFNEPCVHVLDEMLYRMNRTDYWLDPHYAGEYTLVSMDNYIDSNKADRPYEVQFEASHLTGDNTFTDHFIITLLKGADDSKCVMQGCSTRRKASVDDSSTNYCNMYDLYCGNQDWPRCEYVKYDFSVSGYHESFPNCHHRAKRRCHHPPEIAHNLSHYKSTVGGHGMERGMNAATGAAATPGFFLLALAATALWA